ncbi:hypothetical protein [Kordia sp.]|uniref:hypothetical protein n=1 Tax=Kordia sp. TaxID=1965332 RepID=UPI0025C155DC|nr:hypothetical protein [Kordia sp.]MCH2194397.1 hypothetical protein [Kordia sp.]
MQNFTGRKNIKFQKTIVNLDRNSTGDKFRCSELSQGRCVAMSVVQLSSAAETANINLSIIDTAGSDVIDAVDFRVYKLGSLGGLNGFIPVDFQSYPELRVVLSNPTATNGTFNAQVVFAIETN